MYLSKKKTEYLRGHVFIITETLEVKSNKQTDSLINA